MEPRISESKFGRNSKMAAADTKFDLDHGGRHFVSMGAAILNRDVTSGGLRTSISKSNFPVRSSNSSSGVDTGCGGFFLQTSIPNLNFKVKVVYEMFLFWEAFILTQ